MSLARLRGSCLETLSKALLQHAHRLTSEPLYPLLQQLEQTAWPVWTVVSSPGAVAGDTLHGIALQFAVPPCNFVLICWFTLPCFVWTDLVGLLYAKHTECFGSDSAVMLC